MEGRGDCGYWRGIKTKKGKNGKKRFSNMIINTNKKLILIDEEIDG